MSEDSSVPARRDIRRLPRLRGLPVQQVLAAINWRAYGMVLVLILIALAFQYLTEGLFLSPRNVVNLLRQASLVGILALGMVLVLVSGNIDLSAGSAVGLTATVAAWLHLKQGWGTAPAVTAAIATGLACGIWQGFWIARMRVLSFVVTLGGMLIFRGVLLVIGRGETISPLSQSFSILGQGFIRPLHSLILLGAAYLAFLVWAARSRVTRRGTAGAGQPVDLSTMINGVLLLLALAGFGYVFASYEGIPNPVLVLGVIAVALIYVARWTKFGRHLYAIGGNAEAARLSGINIERQTFWVFVLMGLLYGIVGVLLAARLNAAAPNAGFFMELEAIAAAVLGGTSLMGGVGTIEGAVVGALLMQSIANGMSLMNVLTFYQLIVTGLLLIIAVYIDLATKKRPT